MPALFAQPRYYVLAWEGDRAGEINRDLIPLSQLRLLVGYGLIPKDVLLWREGQDATDDAMWRTAEQVLEGHDGPNASNDARGSRYTRN